MAAALHYFPLDLNFQDQNECPPCTIRSIRNKNPLPSFAPNLFGIRCKEIIQVSTPWANLGTWTFGGNTWKFTQHSDAFRHFDNHSVYVFLDSHSTSVVFTQPLSSPRLGSRKAATGHCFAVKNGKTLRSTIDLGQECTTMYNKECSKNTERSQRFEMIQNKRTVHNPLGIKGPLPYISHMCGAPTPYTDREERGESGAQNISSLDAVKRTQVDVVPVQTWAWQGSLLNVWLEVQRHVVFILWHFRLPVFLLWHCATVLRMAYPRRGGSVTTTIHYSIYCMLSAFRSA